jgi:aspartyl-tRNA synthetase
MDNKKNLSENYITYGYVSEIRNFGNLLFLILRNEYKNEQITFFKKDCIDLYNLAKDITKESVVKVIGTKKEAEKAMNGYEVIPNSIEILTKAQAPVPLDISGKIESTFDARINNRFLDLRMPEHKAIFSIRSKIYKAVVDYFDNNNFTNITTPKIVVNGVESGAELFKMDYFGKPAYLSQSPQVYKQMMIIAGFNKVYEIAPVFRAEKSNTTRHMCEFTGIDFEVGFIKDYNEVMDIVENLLKYILVYIKENCKKELEILKVEINIPEKIPRVNMLEVKKLLEEKGKKLKVEDDLDSEAEKLVYEIAKEKYNSEFMFVTNYPFNVRPFYHMCFEKEINALKTTKSFDLIWKGVEISTGAQREHRLEILEKQIQEKEMNLEDMKYYIDMFRYGVPPHGGTGLGLDRITELLLNLSNVKEAVLLPRDPDRLTP